MALTRLSMAQDNFVNGFVITHQGDTLRGYINYLQWENSPGSVSFKEDLQQAARALHPPDVRFFYVEKYRELYEGIEMTVLVRSKKLSSLFSASPEGVWFSGFMHVLVYGPVTLYKLVLDYNNYFYLRMPDGQLEELYVWRQVFTKDGKYFVKDWPVYQSVLQKLENNCEQLKGESGKIPFSEKRIQSFVNRYNTCVQGPSSFVTGLRKRTIKHMGIMAGVNRGSYNFSATYSDAVSPRFNSGHITNQSYAVGGFLMAYLPRGRGRWGFCYELVYKPVRMENTTRYYQVFNWYESKNQFKLDLLRTSALLRHSGISGRLRPFFQGGISLSVPIRARVESEYYPVNTAFIQKENTKVQAENSVVFGAGLRWKKLELEARWERMLYFKSMFEGALAGSLFLKYHFQPSR
jgi:hypothetical protein